MEREKERPIVVLDHVTRKFGVKGVAACALDRLSLSVGEGEFVVIMGPSGSGKTSLLHIIGGLDRPTSGEVYFAGARLSLLGDTSLARLRRRQIGVVFQFFNLLPMLSAEENVALPLMLDGIPRDRCRERALVALAAVGLSGYAVRRPGELSGGEMQRIAIARAIVIQPSLVLADEPTGNLDSQTSLGVMRLLGNLNRKHKCAEVMATHNGSLVGGADRILLLQDGKVAAERELERPLDSPRDRRRAMARKAEVPLAGGA